MIVCLIVFDCCIGDVFRFMCVCVSGEKILFIEFDVVVY